MDIRRNRITASHQIVTELKVLLEKVDSSLKAIVTEMNVRKERIQSLQAQQEVITSTRISLTMQGLAKLRLSLTQSNILSLLSVESPQLEDLLVAKSLCILLHAKTQHANGNKDGAYWQQFKGFVREKDSFYHRLHHFFFNKETVEQAANARVDGASITCSQCLEQGANGNHEPVTNGPSSILLHCIKNWMRVIFQSAVGHEQESLLIQQECEERTSLERIQIDHDVQTVTRYNLCREIEDANSSVGFDSGVIAQLERKIYLSKVMKLVATNGHTVLSWAASSGNEEIVKRIIKAGAHTSIGEETIDSSAIIIQLCFRRYCIRRVFNRMQPSRKSRDVCFEYRAKCLAMTMRISSLHRIVMRRLKRIRLPLAEALFNGHSKLIGFLRKHKRSDDVSLFQAVNLASKFRQPRGFVPRISGIEHMSSNGANLVSLVMPCIQSQYVKDPNACVFVASLRCALELVEEHLLRKRRALVAKIESRRKTLVRKYRQLKAVELRSAMNKENYVDMIRLANEAGISLDFEDDSGRTPLILAASRDERIAPNQLRLNKNVVSAVAYLLDRISPYRPTLSYESESGTTALSAACANGRLEAVKELLIRGANIDQQSILMGRTALHAACIVGKLDAVELLVNRGANVSIMDSSGCTAHDLAFNNKHYEVCEFLHQLDKT